jgi:UDP-N-acetylglucosamine 1-carboxyvinyltransferase
MEKFLIKGEKALSGEVYISGSKNGALPLIAASLLTNGVTILKNVPNLKDITTMLEVINKLGANYQFEGNTIKIDATRVNSYIAPYELVKKMRASIYVLGPLLARLGRAEVSLPGGCAIGPRPVNLHIKAMENLKASIKIKNGFIIGRAKKLKGSEIFFEKVSVGATINAIMAAVLAEGETIIKNAALEPEVGSLIDFLKKMGANIKGENTDTIFIKGVSKLSPIEYDVMPDRIEAGTFILAGVITKSRIKVKNIIPEHLKSLLDILNEMGVKFQIGKNYVELIKVKKLNPVEIKTAPYPGFPTDLQPQICSILSIVPGISVVNETIFENRFTHIPELIRMGANIELNDNIIIIKGVKNLYGAPVMASDLRGGAALVLAALSAKNETIIDRIYHIDRGYEKIENKLTKLGAYIKRIK